MSETKHDIQPGDVVRLKPLTVVAIEDDGGIRVDIGRSYTSIMTPELIDSVEPRPLHPGDIVYIPKDGNRYRIIAIEDDDAWVEHRGARFTAQLSALTRVDQ